MTVPRIGLGDFPRKIAARIHPSRYATRCTPAGVAFIARHEGMRTAPYNDAASPPNATIGIGHMIHRGPVTPADRERYAHYTVADALAQLHADLATVEAGVRDIGVPLRPWEFDALCSFAFNCGVGALWGGVEAALRRGDRIGAMDVLAEYDRAGGRVLPGLVSRRADERALFLHRRYS